MQCMTFVPPLVNKMSTLLNCFTSSSTDALMALGSGVNLMDPGCVKEHTVMTQRE